MGRLPLTEQVRTSMRRFVKWELQVPHGGGRLVEAWVRRMCSRLLQRCGPDDHVILLRGKGRLGYQLRWRWPRRRSKQYLPLP